MLLLTRGNQNACSKYSGDGGFKRGPYRNIKPHRTGGGANRALSNALDHETACGHFGRDRKRIRSLYTQTRFWRDNNARVGDPDGYHVSDEAICCNFCR